MFAKLFHLVKSNAGMAVTNNPLIAEKYHEAVINEASSSIIEVLKSQVETGKFKEVIKYFRYQGIYQHPLVGGIVNNFANKLNNYYGLDPEAALTTSRQLIPAVMEQMVEQSQKEQNGDFGLATLLSKLTGNHANIGLVMNKLVIA